MTGTTRQGVAFALFMALLVIGIASVMAISAGERPRPDAAHSTPPAQMTQANPSAVVDRVAVSVGITTVPTPGATPAPPPLLRHVTHAPGQAFRADQGVYFIDPYTGAVEGWEAPPGWAVEATLSARYLIAQTFLPGGVQVAYLFDTAGGTTRLLGNHEGFPPIAFSSDEERLIAVEADGLRVLLLPDLTLERRIALPGRPWQVDWLPAGGEVLASYRVPGEGDLHHHVARIDLRSGAVREILVGPLARATWLAGGEGYAAGTAESFEVRTAADDRPLWRMTAADFGLTVTYGGQGEPHGGIGLPSLSPDRTRAALPIGDSGPGRIAVIDPARRAVLFEIQNARICRTSWSADGRWLPVVAYRNGTAGTFLVAADGAEVREFGDVGVLLSPVDPRTAGAFTYGPAPHRLSVIDVPTGEVRHEIEITGSPAWDFLHRTWLSDGRLLVHAPHGGHGGCGFLGRVPNLEIQTP